MGVLSQHNARRSTKPNDEMKPLYRRDFV